MQEQEKDLQDYIIPIRKRKTAVIIISAVIFLITVLIAFLLPAKYESSSTILIEQQEIPREMVMSTVTSYAAERIQVIKARVMTRKNLLGIVEKFDLYKDERKFQTQGEIVARMKEDVSLNVISAEVVDPKTGRPTAATIAFSLSFTGESPAKVQRVANELTTLYLNENLTSRAQKASDTSIFFREETERLGERINILESRLAQFKQKHANALPELQALNLGMLQRYEGELNSIDTNLRTLDEKKFYLSGQLALLDPGDPKIPGSTERLKILQAEYASIRSKYSAEHPDVLRLKNEIESLESETGKSNNAEAIASELGMLNAELTRKQKQYTAEHPDVVALKEKIASLNKELTNIRKKPAVEYYKDEPDNPIYITIQSQLAGIDSEITSFRAKRAGIKEKITGLESALFEAPQVEREYLTLRRDYESAIGRYNEMKAKQMQADVAKQLESESKGERFTLIEPAAFPEKPTSPNRPAIMFLGVMLALGCGIGFAIAADVISGSVRGAKSVKHLVGALPLSVIPYEMNLQDRAKTKKIKKRIVILFIAVILFALLFIHFFVSPLDVMWFRILRKIEILSA